MIRKIKTEVGDPTVAVRFLARSGGIFWKSGGRGSLVVLVFPPEEHEEVQTMHFGCAGLSGMQLTTKSRSVDNVSEDFLVEGDMPAVGKPSLVKVDFSVASNGRTLLALGDRASVVPFPEEDIPSSADETASFVLRHGGATLHEVFERLKAAVPAEQLA